MILFGDSIDAQDIPYEYAALYSKDCSYPSQNADKFDPAHRRWYTFKGDPACSMIDFEPGTRDYQTPALLREWLTARLERDEKREAWIYSDLSNAAKAAFWARGLPFRWNVATLDGIRRSRQELSALLIDWGVPSAQAHPYLIVANQFRNDGKFDTNALFQLTDW
jgi:hypothetical protein